MTSVSFSPDGTKVASGSRDKTVKLWDVTSGECLQTLEGHSDDVMSVSFSPDGTKVASGSWTRRSSNVTSGRSVCRRWRGILGGAPRSQRALCTGRGPAQQMPNPDSLGMESKATPDVNGYVGFQNFKLKMKDDHAGGAVKTTQST